MPTTTTPSRPPVNDPELVRASLITLRRKCGKANCRCATGAPHESPALSFWVEGRSRIVTLRKGEVELLKDAVEAYQTRRTELEDSAWDHDTTRAWLNRRRSGR